MTPVTLASRRARVAVTVARGLLEPHGSHDQIAVCGLAGNLRDGNVIYLPNLLKTRISMSPPPAPRRSPDPPEPSRRACRCPLRLLVTTAWPRIALAQDVGNAAAAPQQFSFDLLTAEMQALAAKPVRRRRNATPSFLDELKYDDYRLISFRADRARWADEDSFFRLHAFSMGWLFKDPVLLFEVDGRSGSRRCRFRPTISNI